MPFKGSTRKGPLIKFPAPVCGFLKMGDPFWSFYRACSLPGARSGADLLSFLLMVETSVCIVLLLQGQWNGAGCFKTKFRHDPSTLAIPQPLGLLSCATTRPGTFDDSNDSKGWR